MLFEVGMLAINIGTKQLGDIAPNHIGQPYSPPRGLLVSVESRHGRLSRYLPSTGSRMESEASTPISVVTGWAHDRGQGDGFDQAVIPMVKEQPSGWKLRLEILEQTQAGVLLEVSVAEQAVTSVHQVGLSPVGFPVYTTETCAINKKFNIRVKESREVLVGGERGCESLKWRFAVHPIPSIRAYAK